MVGCFVLLGPKSGMAVVEAKLSTGTVRLTSSEESYLELLRQLQAMTTATLASSPTAIAMIEGTTTATEATTIPLWLAGPSTGTIRGYPLPLSLENGIDLAMAHNFALQRNERDVASAASVFREEKYEFVPFVNFFSGFRYSDDKLGLLTGTGVDRSRQSNVNVGFEAGQRFPTGGDISIRNEITRTRLSERQRIETIDEDTGEVRDVSGATAITRSYLDDVDVVARQPLLRGGGFKIGLANLRLARIGKTQSVLRHEIQRRDLVLNTIRAYFLILQRQLDARVSLDAIREKRRFYDETVIKHQLGEIAESEIWRAQIQLLQEQQRVRQLQQSYLDSLEALLLLMGMPLHTPLRLDEFVGGVVSLEDLGITAPEVATRIALANRTELLVSELAVQTARINVDQAKNGVLPNLDVEGTYGNTETGRHFSDVNDINNHRRWSLGVLFELPLPNMRNREALRRARLRLEQALIDRQTQERDIIDEVRRLYRALIANRERVEILAETVNIAERSLQLENARFFYGENTSIDVRNAQDDLFQARTDYNNALLRYQSDLASMFRSLGWSLYEGPGVQEARRIDEAEVLTNGRLPEIIPDDDVGPDGK